MTCKLRVFLDQRMSICFKTFLTVANQALRETSTFILRVTKVLATACASSSFHLKKGFADGRIDVLMTSAMRVMCELVPYINSWTLMV